MSYFLSDEVEDEVVVEGVEVDDDEEESLFVSVFESDFPPFGLLAPEEPPLLA